ncbi:c-type cytochrome biogenesis protein CcmI [Azospira restricta]|uniref:C-type cytochrome biogenesis protein CcmI n=1 Tax=Azospira restricta TaxID=404405 RepID=A0A974PVW5_9RHOO|nr:c-type cytochrome biogenesis protein CcmI [Azospira restricta]QRJ62430.1 c-type cytochrome biogenesis protein CcmI [Azospira restricta]
MTLFVILAGLLTVGILGALLHPLLRGRRGKVVETAEVRALNLAILREQMAELERDHAAGQLAPEAYEKARQEIERRVLEDAAGETVPAEEGGRRPLLAGALGSGVAALIVGLYVLLGTPEAMTGARPGPAAGGEGGHALGQQQIQAMVQRLAERLQDNPNDGNGWLMLAKSYGVLGRFAESAAAYGRAIALLPPDAQVLADFADTVAMAQGRSLQGEPERIVKDALTIDPNNIKALALSGTIAFERQDYRAAIAQWQKILPLVPEGSQAAMGIQGSIRDAENRLAAAGGAPKAAAGGAAVAGSVTIDPALAAKIAPGDTLFVFARAADGPKMPVAMARMPAGKLPASFLLDDSMSMTPNFKLSQQQKVVIGARISKSGDALPRSGDLEGFSASVTPGAAGVAVVINSIVN